MDVQSTIGSKLFVGSKANSLTADTYIRIGKIENFGEFGDEAEVIKFNATDEGKVYKGKGIVDPGAMQMTIADIEDDPGRERLDAAMIDPAAYNFYVEKNNVDRDPDTGLPLPGHHGTRFYFRALVTSTRRVPGGASDVWKRSLKLELTESYTPVPKGSS
ncbi:hypothetical protein [Azospirillum agricola]|uniref:hypothetical protein n=1 Tax=Azospirillum agricola TaxID=1720247 RepID=UPI000A0F157D|nr:hypothetical protein [Azospirillum agricola]SMH30549.1 hypothetical protein SAMN02982994_0333 [Azospirillum lipoferum]